MAITMTLEMNDLCSLKNTRTEVPGNFDTSVFFCLKNELEQHKSTLRDVILNRFQQQV